MRTTASDVKDFHLTLGLMVTEDTLRLPDTGRIALFADALEQSELNQRYATKHLVVHLRNVITALEALRFIDGHPNPFLEAAQRQAESDLTFEANRAADMAGILVDAEIGFSGQGIFDLLNRVTGNA